MEIARDRFLNIVGGTFNQSSKLRCDLQGSKHRGTGISKAASGAPSTCERMLDQRAVWSNHCLSTGTEAGAPQLYQLDDFVEDALTGSIMDRCKKRERPAIGLLRAISCVAHMAQCQCFLGHIESRTISTFWSSKAVERRETMPVPGRAIAEFEWRCHGGRSSMAEVIVYGTSCS